MAGMIAALLRRGPAGDTYSSAIPQEILTGRNADPKSRLRVDVAQTGFFEGREIRAFRDAAVPAGATWVTRIVVPINIIVFEQLLSIDNSTVVWSAYSGGTPGGTFDTPFTMLRKNEMTDVAAYTPQVSIATGASATHSGGTLRDFVRLVSNQQGNSQTTVGGVAADERGIAPGTYYVRIQNTGAVSANVTYKLFWEERP